MPFREILGHRRLLSLLSQAIARDTLMPSLIFSGPEGVGKRMTAVAVAQALNCSAAEAAFVQGYGGPPTLHAKAEAAPCR